jgi:spoIIIJ-associated protein
MDHQLLKDTLGKLLEKLSLPYTDIKVSDEKDLTRMEIVSPEASRIIGWHGETLNGLQHLVKSIVRSQEKLERSPFIVVDVDGYRKMQEDKVRRIAEQKADFVRRTGNRIALQPMSPYFRRIVHLHIANTPSMSDLTTESVGEGEYRQIVMKMKTEKARPSSGGGAQSEELTPVMAQDDGLENLDV